MQVYTSEISYEDLLVEYKRNMTDMIRRVYQYVRELADRSALLDDEYVFDYVIFCDDYKVFRVQITPDRQSLTFTDYVKYTADRIVVPEDIEWDSVSVKHHYPEDELLERYGKLHLADFIYSNKVVDGSKLIDFDGDMSKYIVGEADGVTEEDKKRVVGYCDTIVIRLTASKVQMWRAPQSKVRHTYDFALYCDDSVVSGIKRVTDWITGIRVDNEASINIFLSKYYVGEYLKEYLDYEEDLIKLIKTLLVSGVKSVKVELTEKDCNYRNSIMQTFSSLEDDFSDLRERFAYCDMVAQAN